MIVWVYPVTKSNNLLSQSELTVTPPAFFRSSNGRHLDVMPLHAQCARKEYGTREHDGGGQRPRPGNKSKAEDERLRGRDFQELLPLHAFNLNASVEGDTL